MQAFANRRVAKVVADGGFARDAKQHRVTSVFEAAAFAYQRHVLRRGFAKAKAGVEDEALGGNARFKAGGDARLQVGVHFGDNVGVVGVVLHGVGHAAHVHQADGDVRVAGE